MARTIDKRNTIVSLLHKLEGYPYIDIANEIVIKLETMEDVRRHC